MWFKRYDQLRYFIKESGTSFSKTFYDFSRKIFLILYSINPVTASVALI